MIHFLMHPRQGSIVLPPKSYPIDITFPSFFFLFVFIRIKLFILQRPTNNCNIHQGEVKNSTLVKEKKAIEKGQLTFLYKEKLGKVGRAGHTIQTNSLSISLMTQRLFSM